MQTHVSPGCEVNSEIIGPTNSKMVANAVF